MSFQETAEKYIAAKNALVAKHTFTGLEEDAKDQVAACVISLLVENDLAPAADGKCRSKLLETEYYGLVALAMRALGIDPALPGILHRDTWEQVIDPLAALTDAKTEITLASGEILRKHRVLVTLNDTERNCFDRELQ